MSKPKITFRQYISAVAMVAKRSFKMAPIATIVQAGDSLVQTILPIATTYFAALTTTALADAYAGKESEANKVLIYVIITAILGVMALLWRSVNSYVSQKVRYQIDTAIKDELLQQFNQLPFALYDDKEVMDLHEKAARFSSFFSYIFITISSIIASFIGAIGAILALSIVSPWLSIIVLIATIPGIVIQLRLARQQVAHWEGNITNRRRRYNIDWTLRKSRHIAEIRIYGAVKHLIKIHAQLRDEDEKEHMKFELKTIWRQLAADVGVAAVELGALVWTALEIVNRQQPVGQFLYVQQMVSRAFSQASGLARQLGTTDDNLANIVDYQAFMQLPISKDKGKTLKTTPKQIQLQKVSFTYPKTDKEVLSDISLTIDRGMRVAIVGENGAGKSTLVKLLMGVYEPSSGRILLDEELLNNIQISSWHDQIALLSQNFVSYSFATMRENITLGDVSKTPKDSAVKRAVEQAEFSEVAAKQKHGLDTFIERWMALDEDDTTATELSGGQAQRLALARNFYRNSPIVILDEPTSAIDALAESRIFDHLFAQKDKTIITISHRLTAVEKADIIYMLEDGRIVESGTHKELVKMRGRYYRMFKSQLHEG